MRVQAANDAALGSPVARTLLRPLQNPKKLGCGMVFEPHSCFLEQMLAKLRYPICVPAENGAWNPPGPLA